MSESTTDRHGLESFLSALPARSSGDDGVRVDVRADLGHINLRGSPSNPAFLSAVGGVLQQDLPLAANTITMGDHRVFWLGPDEWQIVTAVTQTGALAVELRKALKGLHATAMDLRGGQVALHLSGARVRDVLARASTLDLAPASFGVGVCAQSGLAKATALIGLIDDKGAVFEIVVRRSFADYVVRWLQHAATQYKVRFTATR
jgi:sarcosine oxidase subunit gamma